jgi:hypothetical protein
VSKKSRKENIMFHTSRLTRLVGPIFGGGLTALALIVPAPSVAADGEVHPGCAKRSVVAAGCPDPGRPADWRAMLAEVDAPAPRSDGEILPEPTGRPSDWRRMLAEVDAPAPRPAQEGKPRGNGSTDDGSLELLQIALGGLGGAGVAGVAAGAFGARRRHRTPSHA